MLVIQNTALRAAAEKPLWPQALLQTAERRRHVLLASVALLYLVGFNGQWQIEPDSALYLALARNLARGQGYTYQGVAHHLVYSGAPCVMAGLFRIFPGHEVAACDAFVLLCGLAALALTYRLFCLACDRPTAVIVTILTALAHEYFRYCFEIMLEMPFLVGVMAVLAGHEALFHARNRPRWWDWAIFTFGVFAVVNTKPMMLALLAACIAAMPWTQKQRAKAQQGEGVAGKAGSFAPNQSAVYVRIAWATGIIVVLVALFFLYDPRHALAAGAGDSYEQLAVREAASFPARWPMVLQRNLTDLFDKSAARVILGIPLGIAALGTAFGITILAAGIALWRWRRFWGIWVAAVTGKVIFFYSHDRYLLPILPLLMFAWWRIISGLPLILLRGRSRHLSHQARRGLGEVIFVILLAATLIPNVAADFLSDYQQHRRPFLSKYRDGRFLNLARMADELDVHTQPQDTVLAMPRTSRILSYLSDRIVLEPRSHAAPPAGRTFVVMYADAPDSLFDDWVARMHVEREYPPLITLPSPGSGGKSLALLAVHRLRN